MPVRIGKPVWTNNGTWTRLLASERLRRSSHVVSVIEQKAYIFGGEVEPRKPVDDQLDVVSFAASMKLACALDCPTLTRQLPRTRSSRPAERPARASVQHLQS